MRSRLSRSALVAAVALAPACTIWDRFLLEEPVAEVSLVGETKIDQSGVESETCRGQTVLWGNARNTGDLDLDDVKIVIDAYGASGNLLGSFSGSVYSGEIITGEGEGTIDTASTNLLVDQSGSYSVCASPSPGSIARTEASFTWLVVADIATE